MTESRLIGVEDVAEVGQDGLVAFAQKTLSEALDQPREAIQLSGARKSQMRGTKDSTAKFMHLLTTCICLQCKRGHSCS
jgi:DNA-binding Xre family transcriptional regulator